MNDSIIAALLEDLKHPNITVRDRATQKLWQLWFEQKGLMGLETLRQAQLLQESGDFAQAERILNQLIAALPDFAEAWNQRAIFYYLQKQYRKAISDCEIVVRLNPIHFGALHGLGLCHSQLGEYSEAIQAFRRALEIQPHSLENQRLLLECIARLE